MVRPYSGLFWLGGWRGGINCVQSGVHLGRRAIGAVVTRLTLEILYMVTIRLSRGGAKKQPFYHIVATDSRFKRDGRYIERLGYYNPVARGDATPVQLDVERLDYWIGVGAQMSDRVRKVVKGYRAEHATAA